MANKYELAEGGDESLKVKDLFYYGVVKVKGKTHTYISFVSGSNGNNTGRYKAMPLRLISKKIIDN